MRNHPLDPYAVVLFLEVELLQSFRVEVTNIFTLKNLLRFFDVLLALINHVDCFVYLTEQLFRYSANTRSTVNYSIACVLRMRFEVVEYKFEGACNVEGTQILETS